jgi:hypothetical protein
MLRATSQHRTRYYRQQRFRDLWQRLHTDAAAAAQGTRSLHRTLNDVDVALAALCPRCQRHFQLARAAVHDMIDSSPEAAVYVLHATCSHQPSPPFADVRAQYQDALRRGVGCGCGCG